MLKKLRLRFVLINMSIIVAMLLVIFGLVFGFTVADLQSQSKAMLQNLSKGGPQFPRPGRDVRLPYFTVEINVWGDISVTGHTQYDITDKDFIQELIQIVYTSNNNTGRIDKYDLQYSTASGPTSNRIVFLDISSQRETLNSLVRMLLLIGAVSVAAFLVISILLARWAVKPIDQAWKQQTRFVSDASHELKTPLTVIMSNAELLTQDAENQQRYAQNILSSSQHMRNLVEGMLELARADNGQAQTAFTQIDLSKLAEDSAMLFEPVLFEKALQLESHIEPGIHVCGSQQHLYQAIAILLDNAGKYSTQGIVNLRLVRQGRAQCLLTVDNPGNPIPKEELQKIFERFYRADQARSNTGSFGLGLSIAQQIVQQHKGQIWAESNSTGNRFCILLPCEPIKT